MFDDLRDGLMMVCLGTAVTCGCMFAPYYLLKPYVAATDTIYPTVTGKSAGAKCGWVLKTKDGDVPVGYAAYTRHHAGDRLKVEKDTYSSLFDLNDKHATAKYILLEGGE